LGDVVLGELLKEKGLVPRDSVRIDDFIVCVTPEQQPTAIALVRRLRERGRSVGFDYRGRSVGRQFRAADQAGATRAIVIGPDEQRDGTASVRDMSTGDERSIGVEELLAELAVPDSAGNGA
jgi:histidyl-tRNA synthetase